MSDDDPCTDEVCNSGVCASEPNTATCDDRDVCTENDACDAGTCAGTAVAGCCVDDTDCNTGEACVANACTTTCTVDADCPDDGNECTDTVCTNGSCGFDNNTATCDDGDVCTGNDACADGTCAGDAIAGCCTDDAACDTAAGETCNTTTNTCETPNSCTTDADCPDDGLFCNGTESCDTATSVCTSSGDPCTASAQVCSEAANAGAGGCVGCLTNADCPAATPVCTSASTCVECEMDADCTAAGATCVNNACVSAIAFTLGQDNLFGTTGDDTFDGSLGLTSAGVQAATLQTGDSADGKGGTGDVLNGSFNGASGTPTVVATLSNIETLNFSDFGGVVTTVDMTNTTGTTIINTVNSVQTLTVTNIPTAVNLGINSTAQGINASFKADASSSTSDSLSLSLNNVSGGTATITTDAASGFETMTIDSGGSTANTLDALATAGNTATLKTLNVTGGQAVKIKVVPNSLTTKIDASGMTVSSPGLTLGTGTSVSGASAYTTFGTFDIGNLTGSPGDDMFIFGGTLNSNDADGTTEFIDGGNGTDVLQASVGTSLSTAVHLKGIEELRLNNSTTTAKSISLTNVTGINTLTIESDSTTTAQTGTLTMQNFPNIPALAYRGNGAEASQFFDPVTYTTLGGSSGSDTLNVTVGNRGTPLGTSGSSNAFTLGLLTADTIETLNVTVSDTPPSASSPTTLGGITAAGMTSLTVTCPGDLVTGTITGKDDAVATVNLSGVAGRIKSTSTITELNTGATVTLTANNDTVTITPGAGKTGVTVNCGAGDDMITHVVAGASTVTVNGEAGDDTITAGANGDTLNGGNGNDTLNGAAGGDTINGGSGNDTITPGAGADTVDLGAGNDEVRTDPRLTGSGGDITTGRLLTNTAQYTNFTAGAGSTDTINITGITLRDVGNNAAAIVTSTADDDLGGTTAGFFVSDTLANLVTVSPAARVIEVTTAITGDFTTQAGIDAAMTAGQLIGAGGFGSTASGANANTILVITYDSQATANAAIWTYTANGTTATDAVAADFELVAVLKAVGLGNLAAGDLN